MQASFHNFLNTINKFAGELSLKGNKLTCFKDSSEKAEENLEKVRAVVTFIQDNERFLNETDCKSLKQLKETLSCKVETPAHKEQIQAVFDKFIKMAENTKKDGPAPTNLTFKPYELSILVAKAASTQEEVLANLSLVAKYFPRYQLGNNFAVYDTNSGVLPSDTDINMVRYELKFFLEKLKQSNLEVLEIAQVVYSAIKPYTVVPLAIRIAEEEGKENQAGLLHCKDAVTYKYPLLLSKTFLHCYDADQQKFGIELAETFQDCDIYNPPYNTFIVVFPKGSDPHKLGLNLDPTMKWDRALTEIKKVAAGKVAESLVDLSLQDTEDHGFYRLFAISGHGLPGNIANLPQEEIEKKIFPALETVHTKGTHWSSCFAGGANSLAFKNKAGQVPFPVFIQGAQEEVTFVSNQAFVLLEELNRTLFERPLSDYSDYIPQIKALNRKEIAKWDLEADDSDERDKILTFIPAVKQEDLKRYYTSIHASNISSIDQEIKTARNDEILTPILTAKQKGLKEHSALILTSNISTTEQGIETAKNDLGAVGDDTELCINITQANDYYFLEDPIVEYKLIFQQTSPFAFISRGSASHHVIRGMEAPNLSIEKLCEATLNSHNDKRGGYPSKTFVIGLLTCQIEGDLDTVVNVVLRKSGQECFVCYKKGDQYYETTYLEKKKFLDEFPKKKFKEWVLERKKVISKALAISKTYYALLDSTPSKGMLDQLSKGKQTEEDFYTAIKDLFWEGQVPIEATLIHYLATHGLGNGQSSFDPKEIEDLINKMDVKEKATAFSTLSEFIKLLDRSKYNVDRIIANFNSYLYTPLMQAITNNRVEEIGQILELSPQTLNQSTVFKTTSLGIAINTEQIELAEYLLKQGAQLELKERINIPNFISIMFYYIEQKGEFTKENRKAFLDKIKQMRDGESILEYRSIGIRKISNSLRSLQDIIERFPDK
ncbi:MAG: hypothetical protein K0S74_639 [Chlamydiales bacterium]|jgi:hypothetical protein|nr:hypothetical protein [Chlamydiales bacterium]